MRDKDARLALYDRIYRILDLLLGDRIERRRSLVEDKYRRIFEDDSCDRDTLFLAARELKAAVADFSIKALFLLLDKVPDIGFLESRDHVLFSRIRLGVKKVLPDRTVEEISLLRYDADLVP